MAEAPWQKDQSYWLYYIWLQGGGGGGGGTLATNLTQVGGVAITLGQKTMAASLPVTFASNQSTLPVTGTFWQATQPISAAALPLPTGAATSALQGGGLPAALGQGTMAQGLRVVLPSDQTAIPTKPDPGTAVNTPAILTPTSGDTVIAANAARKIWSIQNLGTNPLFVRYAAGATSAIFHVVLKAGTANDDGNGGFISDEIHKGIVSVAGTSPRCVITEIT